MFLGKSTPRFLITSLWNNYEYVEFLNGWWKKEKIPFLLSQMCKDERDLLVNPNYSFRDLWNDAHRYNSPVSTLAEAKFQSIRNDLPSILANTLALKSTYPWTYPKGRKHENETEEECALREFREETRITSNIQFTKHFVYERYIGTDSREYSSKYFVCTVAEMQKPYNLFFPCFIRTSGISIESYSIEWVTLEEAREYLPSRLYSLLHVVLKLLKLDPHESYEPDAAL